MRNLLHATKTVSHATGAPALRERSTKLWLGVGGLLLVCAVGGSAYAQVTPSQPQSLPKQEASNERTVSGSPPIGQASDNSVRNADRSLDADTGSGVVVNQTITVAGQDFYHFFMSAWRDLENSDHYSLAVHERPSARLGSEVAIEFKQRRVFRAYLPPARAAIKPVGIAAATTAYQAVVQADLERQLIRDPDLGADEF